MEKVLNTICIMCPMGCPLTVQEVDGIIVVEGNTCVRGRDYGRQEFTAPMRTVTTLVKLEGGGVASVKTSLAVPKDKMFDVLDFIRTLTAKKDCNIGDVIAKDIIGLNVDLLITGKPQ